MMKLLVVSNSGVEGTFMNRLPFMRKQVWSIARSKRGLFCEMMHPTLRPLAPKLCRLIDQQIEARSRK